VRKSVCSNHVHASFIRFANRRLSHPCLPSFAASFRQARSRFFKGKKQRAGLTFLMKLGSLIPCRVALNGKPRLTRKPGGERPPFRIFCRVVYRMLCCVLSEDRQSNFRRPTGSNLLLNVIPRVLFQQRRLIGDPCRSQRSKKIDFRTTKNFRTGQGKPSAVDTRGQRCS